MSNFFIIRNKEKNMYYWGDGSWTKSKDCAKKYQHKDCAEILMQVDKLDYKNCEVIEIPSITDLEAKLAEKTRVAEGYSELFDKKQHENYEQFCEIAELKQSQNQTAIAVLEKLKKDFEFGNSVSGYGGWELSEITDYIDQQIKELKGEK